MFFLQYLAAGITGLAAAVFKKKRLVSFKATFTKYKTMYTKSESFSYTAINERILFAHRYPSLSIARYIRAAL